MKYGEASWWADFPRSSLVTNAATVNLRIGKKAALAQLLPAFSEVAKHHALGEAVVA